MTTLAQNREPSLRTRHPSFSNLPGGDRDRQLTLGEAVLAVVLRVEHREVAADHLRLAVALQPLCARVPRGDLPVDIEHDDRVVDDAAHQELDKVHVRSLPHLQGAVPRQSTGRSSHADRRGFDLGGPGTRRP